jgi:ribose 5-phosphate isomerase B
MNDRVRQFTTIHLATDHAGFTLKESVRAWLTAEGFTVVDHGAYSFEGEDDFPDFIVPAATAVARGVDTTAGIIFGGSGQGEAMAANRVAGARAVVYYGKQSDIVPLSRAHNDANVLSLGARFVPDDEAKAVIWEWLHTPALPEEKYSRRNKKLEQQGRQA